MMRHHWLLGSIALLAACSASASGSNLPVPASEAQAGDICAREGQTGNACQSFNDRCPDGTPTPSLLTCEDGAWQCRRHPYEHCANVTPTSCTPNTFQGACELDYHCPDGSPVPAQRRCDSNGQSTCTQSGMCEVSNLPVATELMVEFDGPAAGPVYQGRDNVLVHRSTLHSVRANLMVREMIYHFVADRPFFNADNQTFLRNLRLINERTGEVLMGPVPTLIPSADGRDSYITFRGSFQIPAGQVLSLALVVDLSMYADPAFIGTTFSVVAFGDNGHFFPNSAVLDEYRNLIAPNAIEGNLNYTGNRFTLTRPTLAVYLDTSIVSRGVTRNALVHNSATLHLMADVERDQRIIGLTVSGVGNIGSGYRPSDFQRVVTFCQLFVQGHPVSNMVSPDIYGRMDFNNLNLLAPHGLQETVDVTCQIASRTYNPDGPDRIAVTIAHPGDVRLDGVDSEGVVTSFALAQQLTDSPIVTVEVHNHGELTIAPEMAVHRDAPVDGTTWDVVNRYWFSSALKAISLRRIAVRVSGNHACIQQVQLSAETGGTTYGTARVSDGADHVDIDITNPFPVGTVPSALNLLVLFNRTVDPRVNPTGCHAGDELSFTIASNITGEGEWDSSYHTNYNVLAVGNTSGSRIFTYAPPQPTSTFVVR